MHPVWVLADRPWGAGSDLSPGRHTGPPSSQLPSHLIVGGSSCLPDLLPAEPGLPWTMSDHPGHRPGVPRPLRWQTYGHSPRGISTLAHSHHPEVHKDGVDCLGMLSFSTSGCSDLEIQSGIHDAGETIHHVFHKEKVSPGQKCRLSCQHLQAISSALSFPPALRCLP